MEQENIYTRQIPRKQSRDASLNVAQNDEFIVLLRKLDLYKYYPGKLKREDIVGLMMEAPDEKKIERTEDLGTTFLHRLLSCNYGARDLEIFTDSTCKPLAVENVDNPSPTTSIRVKRKQLLSRPSESHSNAIHPLDVVLSVFLCADPILQQDIATQLWTCKLAIPFITMTSKYSIPTAHIWPLRSICARWTVTRGENLVVEEDNILSPSLFTIGFMRLKSSNVEKSVRINKLMSDTEKTHPIFYHRNSKGSARKRILADGMVEISWYLPSSSEGNLFHEPITILNLRGNALKYPIQRQILMEMASICFIVCSSSDLDDEETESIVKTILTMNKKVFFITYDKENKGMKIIPVNDNVFIFNTESLTNAELKESIKLRFRELSLNNSFMRTSINTFSWKGVSVDQEIQTIKDGFIQAELIMDSLLREEIECRKDKLLPLHQDLWKNWVKTDKEIHKLKKLPKLQDITEYRNQLEMKKVYHRREQLKIVQSGVSEAILNFMKALDMKDNISRAVCIRWLKILLDQLSRRELRQLLDKETLIQNKISDPKNNTVEKQENMQDELENLKELNKKSHIGLEHFFRELGQIYEAIQSQPIRERYDMEYDLPLVAARFLLDGNSLEIYDGDVDAVPVTWVSAVFQRLTDMVKDSAESKSPRCTVLAVNGMQSSGKSTLLRTLFGCQFNIGTVRSTRGVQIQILKLNKNNREGRNVDYVLLVDTEGVHLPNVTEEIRKSRDIEIATFVIGLGHKTLINLMGENTSYVTEVLPIVAHAFLRMDVEGFKPSCAIVHQNVDSQSICEISLQNRQLQEEVNSKILSACNIERKEQRQFHDVIKFDVEKDIHYIPSLWESELPMATVTLGYSNGVLKLRNSLQKFFKECKSQSLDSFSSRIKSLWTAITKEYFPYFFQNTTEIEAREQLDKFWCDIVWKLRINAGKFETKMHINIQNCTSSETLEEVRSCCRNKITMYMLTDFADQKTKLTDFVDATQQKYKTYMLQWKASIIDGMTRAKDDIVLDVQQNIVLLQYLKESRFLVERKVQQIKDGIRNEITKYFKREGNKTVGIDDILSNEQIRQTFEESWKGWSSGLENIGYWCEGKRSIPCKAFNVLREMLRNHEASLIEKWNILSCGTVMDFQLQLSHLVEKDVTDGSLNAAKIIVQMKIENVQKRLTELTQDPSLYKTGLLEEIIEMVSDTQNKLDAFGIKTTQEFKIEISVAVASMAISAFTKSENTFLDSFDPRRQIDHEKETCYFLFKKYYTNAFFTLSFTKIVSELLVAVIKKQVDADVEENVADDMRTRVYAHILCSKKSFLHTIMCQMARDGDFRRFMDYIQNPGCSIDYWLGRYVDDYSTAEGDNPSKLCQLVNRLTMCHIKDLANYAKETKKKIDKGKDHFEELDVPVKLWVQEFTQLASTKFEMNKVRSLSDLFGDAMLDFQYFCFELFKQIGNMSPNFDDLTTKGKASYETMSRNVVKMLGNIIIGCRANCPFCGETCLNSQPYHAGLHETHIHRPAGCRGSKDSNTGILLHESCQKLVSDYHWSFKNTKTEGKFVPFKDYKTIYPDWKIIGDPNPLNSSFWEWFMFTYIDNLEKEHHAPRPVLPKSWETYRKDKEILKLEREINI